MKTLFRHYTQETGLVPAALASGSKLFRVQVDPFQTISDEPLLSYAVRPLGTAYCGHNLIESAEFSLLSKADRYVPVSPLFVRDLAGRTIFLGLGPEQKSGLQWTAYDGVKMEGFEAAEGELLKASITFPHGTRSTLEMDGVDDLETVFLTRFRNLEIAMQPGVPASGGMDAEVGVYERANLYPYKLRPDTFYIDGYKLPQTTMLFARGAEEGINPAAGKKLGDELLAAWSKRPTGQTWEQFTEQKGENWSDDLFVKGCTIIPTSEAHNGYNVVSENFELTDYWPGRAVLGLHNIAGSKPSKAPIGTILEVLEPGFITANFIQPAKVMISDGSGYVSPHGDELVPMIPNLHLPHGRSLSSWGACWLPTTPGHFEQPALWGYDVLDTGRFVQISGPLWDPLHYYYASTDIIIAAHTRKVGELVPVPEAMHNRFFPIAAPDGFDTFNADELKRREKEGLYPRTAIVRHATGKPGCNFGYHPLPLEYEYELEPFWMPDMHPLNRDHGPCPEDMLIRVAPVIIPPIGSQVYLETLKVPDDAPWFKAVELLAEANIDPVACYPQLARYILPDTDPKVWLPLFPAPFVAEPRRELLRATAQELWEGMDEPEDLQAIAPGLADVLWDAKEEALVFMRYRHHIYRSNKLLYTLAWWYGLTVDELTALEQEAQTTQTQQRAQNTRQNNSRAATASRTLQQAAAEQPQQRRRHAVPAAGMPVMRGEGEE